MQKKAILIGISVAILAIIIASASFMAIYRSYSRHFPEAPDSLKTESYSFLNDVIGLNLTEYQVVKFSFIPQEDLATYSGLPLYLVRYNLKSAGDEATVDIFYLKSNDTYLHEQYFDIMSNTLFSPAYPSDKVLNWSRTLLEGYTAYKNNASYLLEMQKTLDSINRIEPMNRTLGDYTLQINIKQFSEEDIYTTLQFRPANSTARDYDNAVTLEFHNGAWFNFADNIGPRAPT